MGAVTGATLDGATLEGAALAFVVDGTMLPNAEGAAGAMVTSFPLGALFLCSFLLNPPISSNCRYCN